MPTNARRSILVVAALLSLLPPALGATLRSGGSPPGFAVFPPQVPRDLAGLPIAVPGFSATYFAIASALALSVLAYLMFPSWFGFARAPERMVPVRPRRGTLPWWFWMGLVVNLTCWSLMWFSTAFIVRYLFTPLWWSFITAIDGIVYARTAGRSIFARLPKQLLIMIAVSIVGWYSFEWLNWFVLCNWVYPNSPSIFSRSEAVFWFSLTFTCVWPAIFEWYTLLETFPSLTQRWAHGPRMSASRRVAKIALGAGVTLGLVAGLYPSLLFFSVWLSSLLILPAALHLLGLWTPFSPIARGDWSALTLVALAGLANGFFWEFWNYGSNAFLPGRNPNFWVYEIPYLDVIHLFSEMPLLGYFGYLPFAAQCWAWWLVAAHVFGFDPRFAPDGIGLSDAPTQHPVAPLVGEGAPVRQPA